MKNILNYNIIHFFLNIIFNYLNNIILIFLIIIIYKFFNQKDKIFK